MASVDSLLVVGLLILFLLVTWQRSDNNRHRARIQPDRRIRRARQRDLSSEGDLNNHDDSSTGTTNAVFDEWGELRWIFQLAPHLLAYHSFYNDNLRRQVSFSASSEHSRKERRQIFIGEMLLHKKVVAEKMRSNTGKEGNNSTTNNQKLATKNNPLPTLYRLKSDLMLVHGRATRTDAYENTPDDDDDTLQTQQQSCPICLKEYHVDDEICWSPNRNCNHAFHRECIEAWLLHHENCPMCRQNYCDSSLVPPVSVDGSNEGILIPPALDDDEFVHIVDSVERMYQQAFARLYGHEDSRLGTTHSVAGERTRTPDDSEDLRSQNTSGIREADSANHDIESIGEQATVETTPDLSHVYEAPDENLLNEPTERPDIEQGTGSLDLESAVPR